MLTATRNALALARFQGIGFLHGQGGLADLVPLLLGLFGAVIWCVSSSSRQAIQNS